MCPVRKRPPKRLNVHMETFPQQEQVIRCPARFRVLWCGRRGGKSTTCKMTLQIKALEGGPGFYWWVAPIYRQCQRAHGDIASFFARRTPEIYKNSRKDIPDIELEGGRLLEFRSAEKPDHLRGDGVKHAVVDEPAQISNYGWYSCLYPTLIDEGGSADLIGTPPADPDHWFWKLYQEATLCAGDCDNCNRGPLDVACFTWPTMTNPYVDPEFLKHARLTMPPAIFDREIMATPRLGTSEYFDAPSLLTMHKAALNPRDVGVTKLGYRYDIWETERPDSQYIIGADVAEGQAEGDYSVAQVLRRARRAGSKKSDEQPYELEQVAEFHGYIDPDLFGHVVLDMAARYNRAKLIIEVNGPGIATIGTIRRQGYTGLLHSFDVSTSMPNAKRYGWRTTQKNKHVLLVDLRGHLKQGKILMRSKPALSECLGLRVTPKGDVQPPSQGHDDYIIALALAVQGHLRVPFIQRQEEDAQEYFLRTIRDRDEAWIRKVTGKPKEPESTLYKPSYAGSAAGGKGAYVP